jgi:hypothetical protein
LESAARASILVPAATSADGAVVLRTAGARDGVVGLSLVGLLVALLLIGLLLITAGCGPPS